MLAISALGALTAALLSSVTLQQLEAGRARTEENPPKQVGRQHAAVLDGRPGNGRTATAWRGSAFGGGTSHCADHVSGPEPGLVGYWPFDEGSSGTAHDCSGHGNDGTIYGAGWIAGLQGFALNYDGVNDYIVCDNTVGDEFTLQAWIWTTAESLHGQHAFDGNAILWADYFGIQWNDWTLAVLNNCAAFTTGNPDDTVIGTTHVNDGRWHQVVAVRKRGAYKRLYVDGVLEGEGPTNSQLLDDQCVMCIGGNPIDQRYLRGLIDEVRIYDRELSAEEIEQLYHRPSGFYPGDLNCDGLTNAFDIYPFVLALTDPGGYQAALPCCKRMLADCNADGAVNAFDIDPFVLLLTSGPVHLACCYEGYLPVQCVEGVELRDCVAGGGRWDIEATSCADLAPPCGAYYGACCDPIDGGCQDEVAPSDCGSLWYFQGLCAELDPPCGDPGACCADLAAECTDGVLAANCDGRHSSGTCAELSPACGTVCAHRVDLYEGYYDGWNGNTLDVYVDGVLVLDGITLPGGLGPLSFEFLAGTGSVIHTIYHAIGSLPYMPYYRIFDGLGTLIMQDGSSYVEPSGLTVYGRCEGMQGACCDPMTGICDNDVSAIECTTEFHEDAQCEELSPLCGNPGACCDDSTGICVDGALELQCATRFAAGTLCVDMLPWCVEPYVPGACCYGTECVYQRPYDCVAGGGEYQGDGVPCDPNPCLCADFYIDAPGTWSGSTCGAGDDCGLRAGEEVIFAVNIPYDGLWTFSLCGSDYDTYWYFGYECCTSYWSQDDSEECGLAGYTQQEMTAGTYYIDLESYSTSGCGNYELTITGPEEHVSATINCRARGRRTTGLN